MQLFAEIRKIDSDQRMVYGYASTDTLDAQGEIIKREAVEAALPEYMRFANIREMHQASAVGIAQDAEIDDRGLYIAAKIIDEDAWDKVKAGVYKGFSIGGKVVERDRLNRSIVTGCQISEISLVDRPANAECVFDLYKADSSALPGEEDPAADGESGAGGSAGGSGKPAADSIARLVADAGPEALQLLHDLAALLGADCPSANCPADSAAEEDAEAGTSGSGTNSTSAKTSAAIAGSGKKPPVKVGKVAANDGMAKLASLSAEVESLRGQLRELGGQPAAGGAVLKAIGKGEDLGALDQMDDEADDPISAIRKAHRRPIPAHTFLMGR